MIEPMAAYRSMRETFGRTPDGLDDERFIAVWVELALAYAAEHGIGASSARSPGRLDESDA